MVLSLIDHAVNVAYATTTAEYITPLATELTSTIGDILPGIFAVGIFIFSVMLGWRLLKRFTGK